MINFVKVITHIKLVKQQIIYVISAIKMVKFNFLLNKTKNFFFF